MGFSLENISVISPNSEIFTYEQSVHARTDCSKNSFFYIEIISQQRPVRRIWIA
jgi:hypothetical protein